MKNMKYWGMALLGILALASCSDDKESASQTLSVAAFSPTIIMDNQSMQVTGTDMGQVTEAEFPGGAVTTDITPLDARTLYLKAPAGISTTDGPIILRTSDGQQAESRQLMHLAQPQFQSYEFTSSAGALTNSNINIYGTDLLPVSKIIFALDGDTATVGGVDMMRKSNEAIKVTIPDKAPTGKGVSVKLGFQNGTTMDLPSLDIDKGLGDGHWERHMQTIFSGPSVYLGNYARTVDISSSRLQYIEEGDTIRVLMQYMLAGCEYTLYDGVSGESLGAGYEHKSISSEERTQGYYDIIVTKDVLKELQNNGLKIGGQRYGVAKVQLFSRMWVSDVHIDLRDPITDETVMVLNFEKTDSHDPATMDDNWTVPGANTWPKDDDGNTFVYVQQYIPDGWMFNCNHLSVAPIDHIENYYIKFDCRIDQGVEGASNAEMQYCIGNTWMWVGKGFLPETTNGQWITVTRAISDISDLSGTLKIDEGTSIGFYGNHIPAGVAIDNVRFDPKF